MALATVRWGQRYTRWPLGVNRICGGSVNARTRKDRPLKKQKNPENQAGSRGCRKLSIYGKLLCASEPGSRAKVKSIRKVGWQSSVHGSIFNPVGNLSKRNVRQFGRMHSGHGYATRR